MTIESKLFDVCGWPVVITAEHWQSQPTTDTSGAASFEILDIEILDIDIQDDEVTLYDKLEVDEAVFGSDFEKIREEFLTNSLL